jgi:bacterioferritin (cytochrome b1)
MTGDPSVNAALNACLRLEITAFEVLHAFEHAMKRRKYKALRGWFDDQVGGSRRRRRYLTDRIFALDGEAMIAMNAAPVDPSTKVPEVLDRTLALATELLAAYQAAYATAESAGDNVTADGLCDLQEDAEELVGTLEAFLAQIEEVGLPSFLTDKIRA